MLDAVRFTVLVLAPVAGVAALTALVARRRHGPPAPRPRADPAGPDDVTDDAATYARGLRWGLGVLGTGWVLSIGCAWFDGPGAAVASIGIGLVTYVTWEAVGESTCSVERGRGTHLFDVRTGARHQWIGPSGRPGPRALAIQGFGLLHLLGVAALGLVGVVAAAGGWDAVVVGPRVVGRAPLGIVLSTALAVGVVAVARAGESWVRRAAADDDLPDDDDLAGRVLYLRTFALDEVRVRAHRTVAHRASQLVLPPASRRFEDATLWPLLAVGPVVAVAPPRHRSGPLGGVAGRLPPLPDDRWRVHLAAMAASATAVVVVLGATRGLRWEVDLVTSSPGLRAKTLLVLPPGGPAVGDGPLAVGRLPPGLVPLVAVWPDGAARPRVLGSRTAEDLDYHVAIERALLDIGALTPPDPPRTARAAADGPRL